MSEFAKLVEGVEHFEATLMQDSPSDVEGAFFQRVESIYKRLANEKSEAWLSHADALMVQLQNAMLEFDAFSDHFSHRCLGPKATDQEIAKHEAYIDKQLAKQRLASLVQGGLSGHGGAALAVDMPAQLWLHARTVASLAQAYGFTLENPLETVYAVRILYLANLPAVLKGNEWRRLFAEIEAHEEGQPLYSTREEILTTDILIPLLLELLKVRMMSSISKRPKAGGVFVAASVGGVCNYRRAKQVTQCARCFYQKRWIRNAWTQKG
ncbi:EcsC family protein [Shouchella shacheensis]|uniref:EcsC family protein n=1 Tax=Shouchella shacheensis TaxID=1649580 RepID=UPI0007400C89|nr:EcsC family protein [Shouchella shacheensis]